ncbi:MAG: alpha/beta fold hydrolase [Nitrospirae bacterium]|nr:alpha/beta fold hydrolase [Nitrospirota bacterium]
MTTSHDSTFQPVLPFQVPRDLYPFQDRFYSVRGMRIHYVDEGAGQIILFLHGNPTWSFVYRDVIKGLRSNRYRCIAPDYPGFGMSAKPKMKDYGYTPADHAAVIEGWISALKFRDITLFVQDWGGPIGFTVASHHPEWFKRLIIANTWAWPVNGDPHFERFSKFVGGPLGGLLIRYLNIFVDRLLPAGTARKEERLTPPVMAAYRAPFQKRGDREPMHVFPREILRATEFLKQAEAGLAKLRKKPTLILWGEKDIAFRKSEFERWRTHFPEARVQAFPNAGHFIQEDAPDEVAAAIRNWM